MFWGVSPCARPAALVAGAPRTAGGSWFLWGWWAVSFAVFRFFDAVKPPPIKWFDQRVSGGLGVMLDDVIAAVLSIVVIWLLVWLC